MPWLDRTLDWLKQEVIDAPLTPVLHPSPLRMKGLGLFTLLGHPLFYCLWAVWLPQPYESLWLRIFAALLGCLLISKSVSNKPSGELAAFVFSAVSWFELPFMFSWFYWCNNGNPVWLASACSMIFIYYFVTDWRIASVGLTLGGLLTWGLFQLAGPEFAALSAPSMPVNAVVIGFSISISILLGVSAANLRRQQLNNTLATIGIMAHELRTPLSTAALLGDAIQLELERQPDNPRALHLTKLATRLHALVRNMNRQIDTQIANAKLLELPRQTELVSAGQLVTEAVANYPYLTQQQRGCVTVVVHKDFIFLSSATQFSQVLDNLIKNGLHSLMAADSAYPDGALSLEVNALQGNGRIIVKDHGTGIESTLLPRIFKPFFSSNKGTGHGLGLAFCQQVVASAGGSIDASSETSAGATFTIELPLATDSSGSPPANFQ